jgi:hypothetical protein
MLIEKIEKLWMVNHQKHNILITRVVSLGFARRVTMEMAKKPMNWVLYAEWKKQEQQHRHKGLLENLSDAKEKRGYKRCKSSH